MRFHRLVLQAIGPFAGRHEVDFDALSVSGLFLLNGPTGAGKSTLIDAVEFALYGARDELKERMVSGHAAPGAEPFVELVFSNSRGMFRVVRTPEHERPKQRGSGTTRVNGTARLFRLTSEDQIAVPDAGEPVTSSAAETGAAILELVQLSREQFTQTVVLPQGKFATFLTTPPDARAKVLQDVFGTEIYDLTQERLREAATAARQRLEAHLGALRSAATHMWKVGSGEDLPEITPTTDLAHLVALAGTLAAAAGARHSAAMEALSRASATARAAAAAAEGARELADNLTRRRDALTRLAALDAEGTAIDALRARVARADAAGALGPALEAYGAATRDAATASAGLAREVASARRRGCGLADAFEDDAALGALRDGLVEECAGIRRALPAALGLAEAHQAQQAAHALVARLESERTARQADLADVVDRRRTLESEIGTLADARADLAAASAAHEQARALRTDARTLAALQRDREVAATRLTEAVSASRAALERATHLQGAWLDSLAGELASGLQPGAPCPVCGSDAHPRPATRPADAPSRADVQRARDRAAAAEEEAAQRQAEHSRADARVIDHLARLEGRDPDEVEAIHAAAETRLRRAREAEERTTEIRVALDELAVREASVRSALADVADGLPGARAGAAEADARAETLSREVDSARGSHATVAEALADAEARLAHVTAVREARALAHAASERLESTARQLAEQCAHLGFATPAAAQAAAMEPAARAEARARIEEYEADRAAQEARLREPSIAGLTGDEDPRLEEHRARVAAAQETEQAAAAAEGDAHRVQETCSAALADLGRSISAYHAAVEEASPVLRMERVARGENERHTSLSNWVLLRRFDEVLGAANRRLGTMSDGRYELVRTEDRESGRRHRRGGLALEIRDHHIGRGRSPHSLSGGETFYTSLSLALGLADVVSDEAGGVELGTLFVDEGFGSLDQTTLGNVMEVLHGLGRNGRAVGIVSHVGELKSQIAEQVEVRRLPAGGSTIVVHA